MVDNRRYIICSIWYLNIRILQTMNSGRPHDFWELPSPIEAWCVSQGPHQLPAVEACSLEPGRLENS